VQPWILLVPPCSEATGPPLLVTEVVSRCVQSPLEILAASWPSDCFRRTDSPEVFRPLDDLSRASPVVEQVVILPRFRSQAFSTSQRFPGKLEIVALFRATAALGFSLQSFSLAEIAHPSRGHCSPAVIHPSAGTCRSRTCHSSFHRRPRSRAVA
jgi:hypothetical protein